MTDLRNLRVLLQHHLINRLAVRTYRGGAEDRERWVQAGKGMERCCRAEILVHCERDFACIGIANREEAALEVSGRLGAGGTLL